VLVVVEVELENHMLVDSTLSVVDHMIIVDHNLVVVVVIDQPLKYQQHLAYLARHKLC
jgi:hypothetical protein